MVAALVSLLAGAALVLFGVQIDAETQATLLNHIDTIVGSIIMVYGLALGIFRKITTTPMKGLITKETSK
jgi:uncharacterized membrane protein